MRIGISRNEPRLLLQNNNHPPHYETTEAAVSSVHFSKRARPHRLRWESLRADVTHGKPWGTRGFVRGTSLLCSRVPHSLLWDSLSAE